MRRVFAFAVFALLVSGVTAEAGFLNGWGQSFNGWGQPFRQSVPAVVLTAAPKSLAFPSEVLGTIGTTSPDKIVTISNKTHAPVALSSLSVTGDFAIDRTKTTCAGSVAASGTSGKCLVAVDFTPTALGKRPGKLTVTFGAGSQLVVTLSGVGIQGQLGFSPKSLSFANQAAGTRSPPKTVTLTNSNAVPIRITSATVSSAEFPVASKTCGSVLAPGATCAVRIGFQPAVAGSRKGKLFLRDNAAHSPQTVALQGKGTGGCNPISPNICGGKCTNVLSDSNNCGGCGDVCGGAGSCFQGQCFSGTLVCDVHTPNLCPGSLGNAECTDVLSDAFNCGGCGNACLAGQLCIRGVCEGCVDPTPDLCGGACTDTLSDPLNCGACGNLCSSGICDRGQCQTKCSGAAPDICGGQCTSILTDADNCGGCGNVCPDGEQCQQGACAGVICAGSTPDQCGSQCTNLATDPNNCGSCSNACTSGACVQGQCVSCTGATPDQCGEHCTDFQTDASNCGACGKQCANGGACLAGVCQPPACPEVAPTDCSGLCTDTSSDSSNCGGCGNFCFGLCEGGTCGDADIVCASPTPNKCGGECTDLSSDPFNCGKCGVECPTGDCVKGSCHICAGDVETPDQCGSECTNLNTDPFNCGSCGNTCADGSECEAGICQSKSCTDCGDGCVDLRFDKDNCGTCGNLCADNELCINGTCKGLSCNAPLADKCPDGCTDLQTDPLNCGTCGTECQPDEQCEKGVCQLCVDPTPDQCGQECTDLQSDDNNCGTCGNACPGGAACTGGICVACTGATPDQCGSACVDFTTDNSNCGGCGIICTNGNTCQAGFCSPPCVDTDVNSPDGDEPDCD